MPVKWQSYTSMNLHYSQTVMWNVVRTVCLIPLWIYITLKPRTEPPTAYSRLIPLWIYITLKRGQQQSAGTSSLIPLWIYITLKHAYQLSFQAARLIPLWIYITLKLLLISYSLFSCLIPLWIYITLKRVGGLHCLHTSYTSMNLHYSQTGHHAPAGFKGSYTSMNLHYSQTSIGVTHGIVLSYTSMNLHYSQTLPNGECIAVKSYTSMNLHYSQTKLRQYRHAEGLIPLWIYITLKLYTAVCPSSAVLYLYEFTLLSNRETFLLRFRRSYTSMNLHYSQTNSVCLPLL